MIDKYIDYINEDIEKLNKYKAFLDSIKDNSDDDILEKLTKFNNDNISKREFGGLGWIYSQSGIDLEMKYLEARYSKIRMNKKQEELIGKIEFDSKGWEISKGNKELNN